MAATEWDIAWINARIMTCEHDMTIIDHAAMTASEGRITWIGKTSELIHRTGKTVIDVAGRLLTPGFIDCHTHLIYGGNRADEFAQRLEGTSYSDIAKAGGGIRGTVEKTRAASFDSLLRDAEKRARECMQNGVTTLEIKSGYGLNLDTEMKMLRVARTLQDNIPMRIKTTFLGAHTVPVEYHNRPDDYIDYVINVMLPAIVNEHLADAIDVFCENIAFNVAQTERLFKQAAHYHLPIKCHAEQLSASGATTLAAAHHALSVDHLEHLTEEGVKALAQSNTVAVLLPGAFYCLRDTHLPPITHLRQYQVPIAIASDHNPGTSPILSLLTIMNMAATLFRLTPTEIFLGVTKHAAKALGMDATCGTLAIGKAADFAIWDVESPIELLYYVRQPPLWQRVFSQQVTTLA